jgi:16S rRNA C967 or C1407 C5-methylase (RsmB/RsmF family)
VILYSTCSIDPDENQAQAEFIRSLGFELRASKATMPNSTPRADKASGYRDGGFAASLRMLG